MLKKRNRLTRKDVDMLFKGGKFVVSPNLTFKYSLEPGRSTPLVSFIAPKTASKLAVKRNLLRRRGYAVLKGYFSQLPPSIIGAFVFGKKSFEVFGAKNSLSKENLSNEIKKILSKIN
jgi:ribonuclease P protein component